MFEVYYDFTARANNIKFRTVLTCNIRLLSAYCKIFGMYMVYNMWLSASHYRYQMLDILRCFHIY
jgi:hypothetical protein